MIRAVIRVQTVLLTLLAVNGVVQIYTENKKWQQMEKRLSDLENQTPSRIADLESQQLTQKVISEINDFTIKMGKSPLII